MLFAPSESFARDVFAPAARTDDAGAYQIHCIGVLGAGTMGARSAAHFANAGYPVVLLDLATSGDKRSSIAAKALEALKAL